jgi:hypothetical protein
MGVELLAGREVQFHYGGEPVLRPGLGKVVWVTIDGREDPVQLRVPEGWRCAPLGPARFELLSEGPVADGNELTVVVDGTCVNFAMLGPGQAKGFAAGDNVPTCPRCHARAEACICDQTDR